MKVFLLKKIVRFSVVISLSGLILAILITSCEKYNYDPPTIDPDVEKTFAADVLPIFTSSCAFSNCHGGPVSPNLTVEKAYESINNGYLSDDPVNDPESSRIYSKLLKSGHSEKASEIEKLIILNWISHGAKNN